MASKTIMVSKTATRYESLSGGKVLEREYGTKTPNGNTLNGQWVLRDDQGAFLDFDQYRFDLADRQNLSV